MGTETTARRGRQSAAKNTANSATTSTSAAAATLTETETAKVETQAAEEKTSYVPTQVDPHTIVTVRNGFQGQLIYKSQKTGERFVWDGFGAEQDMEIGELRNAKSSNKKFFENNWFMFDEEWIVEYLGLGKFYRFAISVDGFDDFFKKTPEELEEALSQLSDGQKKSVAYRARQLIAEGEIDSNKIISTLERCLGTELVERDR
jgi:hypothetical protein